MPDMLKAMAALSQSDRELLTRNALHKFNNTISFKRIEFAAGVIDNRQIYDLGCRPPRSTMAASSSAARGSTTMARKPKSTLPCGRRRSRSATRQRTPRKLEMAPSFPIAAVYIRSPGIFVPKSAASKVRASQTSRRRSTTCSRAITLA